MSSNKKPAILVACLLVALIALPLIIWVFTKIGGGSGAPVTIEPGSSPVSEAEVVDYDLSQLAEKAENLLSGEVAEALRKGDVSLDFVAELKKEADKGLNDMRNGKLERARERLLSVVNTAEQQLAAIAAADKARALKNSIYSDLQRLEPLRSSFENTYREAVESYNQALRSLESREFVQAVDEFELAGAILGDLEARSIQQVAALLETAQAALQKYDLNPAREGFEAVLEIDSANAEATKGLTMIAALEGISDEVKAVQKLEKEGKLEEALAALEPLIKKHPNNPFLKQQRNSIEERILQSKFDKLVAQSVQSEEAGDYAAAIAELEAALKLKKDSTQQARLDELQEKYKSERMEVLLDDGYQALKEGRYEAARNLYKEAVALDSNSKEARTGLEKASSLYLASVRYTQNIKSAERYIKEGRFPLAAKLFNEAMTSRPAKIAPDLLKKETEIRDQLETQSKEVPVTINSDGRTYVSIIGVLPPERFKEKDLKLFPDVYKIRGTRKGYEDVEIELKVDATKGSQTIEVECTQKI